MLINRSAIHSVDAYGTLVSSRLYLPSKACPELDYDNLKLSNQRGVCDLGENPLPIYCAIRHELSSTVELEKEDRTAERGSGEDERRTAEEKRAELLQKGKVSDCQSPPGARGRR